MMMSYPRTFQDLEVPINRYPLRLGVPKPPNLEGPGHHVLRPTFLTTATPTDAGVSPAPSPTPRRFRSRASLVGRNKKPLKTRNFLC